VKCSNCPKGTMEIVEIGWRKHRVVGRSPDGYQFSVLTKRVPTAIATCVRCGHERHGWIDDHELILEEEVHSEQS
jgi:hypothetical protein